MVNLAPGHVLKWVKPFENTIPEEFSQKTFRLRLLIDIFFRKKSILETLNTSRGTHALIWAPYQTISCIRKRCQDFVLLFFVYDLSDEILRNIFEAWCLIRRVLTADD